MNAKNFEATETLKNGVTVRIRAIRPADKAAIVEAFGKLDPESVYTRFFQFKPSLSAPELKATTEVDFENVVALVVTTESGGKEIIIGGGRYVTMDRSRAPLSAEIAFLIEEDFHGQGIAGRLLKHLVHLGREKGVSQFEAEVLAQNMAMLAVFSRSGERSLTLPPTQCVPRGVAQIGNLLCRRMAFGRPWGNRIPGGLPIRDPADCQSALRWQCQDALRSGLPMQQKLADGTIHVTLSLTERPEPAEHE